ncbi:MAG TPA: DUF1906 domain-containing protein [Steroidobacteraceae bacterium]
MSIEGVDYAWDGPSPDALVAAGKKFAVRYGGPGSAGKQLTAKELSALKAAGIAVVANAEGVSNGFRGFSSGKAWAQSAWSHFSALGMPADRPIYFSVDWDAGPSDWSDIDLALHGAASVIGSAQVGVYGGYDTIAHCWNAGTARWFWQTYAWSGTKLHRASHLYQYRNGVQIGGSDLDLDRALQADFGQWGVPIGDDVNVDDLVKDSSDDGIPETRLGHYALSQGIPDGTLHGQRVAAWQAIQNLGTAVTKLQASVDALAARPAVTVSEADLATALVDALKQLAAPKTP